MATLTGQQIDGSYQGLIKTTDNGAISGTAKAVTDGLGNATNIEISNTATNFVSGTVDFTGSTVSGLPSSAAGLVAGTGSESIESAITSTVANASATGAIALGDAAVASAAGSVAIGKDVTAATANTVSVKALETQTDGGVAIKGDGTNAGKLKLYCEDASGAHNVTLEGPAHAGGASYSLKLPNVQSAGTQILEADASGNLAWINTPSGGGGSAGLESGTGSSSMQSASSLTTTAANASGSESIALGNNARAAGGLGIAIGNNAHAQNNEAMAIGPDAFASGNAGTLAVGRQSNSTAIDAVAVGRYSNSTGSYSAAFGRSADAQGEQAVAVGYDATATGNQSIAIGDRAIANAVDAVAIGQQITGSIASTVSVKALEVQTDSTPTAGGIIISDAGGTDRRLNINASGALQVDSAAVGAAPMVSLPRSTGTYLSGCDVIYSSVLIPANTFAAGDILQLSGAMSASGSANTIWSAYWISTNGTVGGSATEEVNMGQLSLSQADWAIGFQKNLYVNVADGTGTGTELVSGMAYTDVDGTVNTSGISTYTPDCTSNLYLVNRTCIQASNTGVAYVDHGAVLKKIN